ncbi:T9SS type A sorting domain-containing protein [bacterium]|nr:T9SS type A sorting domain-containing protein [bacterium]
MAFRLLTIILLSIFSSALFAQSLVDDVSENRNKRLYTDKVSPELSPVQIASWLKTQFDLTDSEDLRLLQKAYSNNVHHFTFKHYFKGKPVYMSGIKVHIYSSGKTMIQSYLHDIKTVSILEHYGGELYLMSAGNLYLVYKKLNSNKTRPVYEYFYGDDIIKSSLQSRYYRDTTAKAKVFYPNPIVTADTVYGGNFKDFGDANNPSLEAQLVEVEIPVRFENDSFYLEQQFLRFEEIGFPYENDDYKLDNDSFFYTRDQQRFEAVNAYYHLTNYMNYVENMGYSDLIDSIVIDVHGLGGSDQSQFNPDYYSIQYGEGGVDDAEDADVVVHEYGHALSETGSPETLEGKHRKAMEEGTVDYLARSYGRSLTDQVKYKVFSWDGHNDFWNGSTTSSNKKYEDVTGGKDSDREIWSSTLMCIHDYVGRNVTDSLVLEYLFYLTPESSYLDHVQILLAIDTNMNGGRNAGYMRDCFVQRGFLSYASVEDPLSTENVRMLNSAGFAEGNEALEIILKEKATVTVLNALGQKVAAYEAHTNFILNPSDFESGLYILQINYGDRSLSFKVIR